MLFVCRLCVLFFSHHFPPPHKDNANRHGCCVYQSLAAHGVENRLHEFDAKLL